jgi:hypothetical protein
MAPFLGVVATEPAGQEQVSAIVSGSYGGNLVLRDLGVGSHLFLPVAKPGGRVYVELFTPDAVLDSTQGRHAGRQALRAAVGPVWSAEGPATLHLTLNPVIELSTAVAVLAVAGVAANVSY